MMLMMTKISTKDAKKCVKMKKCPCLEKESSFV